MAFRAACGGPSRAVKAFADEAHHRRPQRSVGRKLKAAHVAQAQRQHKVTRLGVAKVCDADVNGRILRVGRQSNVSGNAVRSLRRYLIICVVFFIVCCYVIFIQGDGGRHFPRVLHGQQAEGIGSAECPAREVMVIDLHASRAESHRRRHHAVEKHDIRIFLAVDGIVLAHGTQRQEPARVFRLGLHRLFHQGGVHRNRHLLARFRAAEGQFQLVDGIAARRDNPVRDSLVKAVHLVHFSLRDGFDTHLGAQRRVAASLAHRESVIGRLACIIERDILLAALQDIENLVILGGKHILYVVFGAARQQRSQRQREQCGIN